jgi:hypothetical protein
MNQLPTKALSGMLLTSVRLIEDLTRNGMHLFVLDLLAQMANLPFKMCNLIIFQHATSILKSYSGKSAKEQELSTDRLKTVSVLYSYFPSYIGCRIYAV